LHLIVQCRMYTTEIDPDLVSRFIPLSYSIFPRFRLKRIRPEPGIVSPRLLVTCSLACSLDPKDATDPNIQQRQRKCKYKHTPFGFPMQDTLQNKQKREQMTDGHEKKVRTQARQSCEGKEGQVVLSQLLHNSHDRNAESR